MERPLCSSQSPIGRLARKHRQGVDAVIIKPIDDGENQLVGDRDPHQFRGGVAALFKLLLQRTHGALKNPVIGPHYSGNIPL